MAFVHLHNHTHYSILEGLPKPKDYVKRAKELGMTALAITDTGNTHGCHEFYKACKAEGINPILGAEVFVQSELDQNLSHKLVLLATSLKGYKNIIAIISKGSLDNPGRTPVILLEDIAAYTSDIICLSGTASSEIAYYILAGKSDEEVVLRIKKYQEIFGEENYFLELLEHDDVPKQKFITEKLIEFHNTYDIPVVATNNCYYVDKDDKSTQDVIMALWKGYEIENPDRPTLINGDYSLLSEEEMQVIFGYIPGALENTQKIADRVDIDIPMGDILIPRFELPEADQAIFERAQQYQTKQTGNWKELSSDEWYLRYLSFKGLNWRYKIDIPEETIFDLLQKTDKPSLEKKLTETTPEELKDLSLTYYSNKKKKILKELPEKFQERIERLEYELVVVHEMGFDGYFLIVADYIGWARQNGIPVGPGRGSAAGSLMAYLTGITDLDPIDYGLLFERFLNPARISMPDIDTDFSDTGRDRVVDYCRQKYGEDHVAQICTFGTFAARAAVKDVGRVKGIPFTEMNELAKLIPEKPGTKLQGALDESPEFKQAYESSLVYKDIIDNALKIEGNVRQLWVHACAVIIAPEPMTQFTALARPPKDSESIVTQYSAYPLEDLGLLKMDFLWLRTLTIIERTLEIVKETKGIEIDMEHIDISDTGSYEVFAKGDSTGVFQFESDGMRKYLKDLKPDSFEDIIAMVSLYRPGPMAYIPEYIDRKYGREDIVYMTDDLIAIMKKKKYSDEEIEEQKNKLEEDLKKILDVTYGIAVYQEQLMFIVQYMAGFSLWEADLLRRWVGKKIAKVIEEIKVQFIEKAESFRGYKPEVSQYIYEEMIQPAANYSFNKSHAACYAYIAYQTAYLKANFPTEFLTALMMCDEENMDRITLEVAEAQSKGINILPPDVNHSLKHFTYIDDKNIRFGLKAVKGLGDGPIDGMITAREDQKFENISDFIERWGKEVTNKKALEALILAWAMDDFWERNMLLSSIDNMIRYSRALEKKKESSQIGLFDMSESTYKESLQLQQVKPFTYEQKLFGEKDVMGFMVSGHPLDSLQTYCGRRSTNVRYLKMSMEELTVMQQADEEKFKKDIGATQLKAIGVILDTRKIVTKTGKNMMFLYCEGFDYDFEVTIYDRYFDDYKNKVDIGKVIVVEGRAMIDPNYNRKAVSLQTANVGTLTQVRAQARDMGLLDNSVRKSLIPVVWKEQEDSTIPHPGPLLKGEGDKTEDTKFEKELEGKISENKEIKAELAPEELKYVIQIPSIAKKDDLNKLKDFLTTEKPWGIGVFIQLSTGQEVDTKFSVASVEGLEKWEEENLRVVL